ncbi:CpsD/CapB family tyrosine-protein kinase [Paenibacillus senegalensis]|uniref:CpsD/CapB family tyrosine-protein kinase n=1 Tax=Paenibacillus senegalensis TaxID=1465766 RepID=UPI000288962B|nr:CpsD/CapB family tyrosine-protein kinase [Paenibacillus senegalensis]
MRALVNSKALAVYYQPDSWAAEAFRSLRTNLHYCVKGKQPQAIIVTSVQPEDSKVAICNLAISLAQEKEKVLLIDAELRNPSLHSLFSLTNEIGLGQYPDWKNAVLETEVPDLFVLPAGRPGSDAAISLSSSCITQLLQEGREEYSWLIIHCPSVSVSADALVWGAQADGVLLLLHPKKTKKSMAAHACKQLDLVGANLLGTVMIQD